MATFDNSIVPVVINATAGTAATRITTATSLVAKFAIMNQSARKVHYGGSGVTTTKSLRILPSQSLTVSELKLRDDTTWDYDLNNHWLLATASTTVSVVIWKRAKDAGL